METNKIDEFVKKSLQEKTLQPSNSAWERLSIQLGEAQKIQRRKKMIYWSYAASVALLISIVFYVKNKNTKTPIIPAKVVVLPTVDTTKFIKPTIKNTAPIEKALVKISPKKKEIPADNFKKPAQIIQFKIPKKELDSRIVQTKETNFTAPVFVKKNPNSRIKVNSDDLLYAVTHSKKEVQQYYAKYHIDRNQVLKNIRKELQKNKLKVSADSLLAEVEKTVDEETFKKSFLQVIKGKITGLAEAFSNRNN